MSGKYRTRIVAAGVLLKEGVGQMAGLVDQFVRRDHGVVSQAAFVAAVAIIVLLAGAGTTQAARQVTLTAVADSGLYGDSGSGRANRGAGGRFDIGSIQNVLLKFDLSGVLGAQEVIQTAVLQFKEAKGDRYAYGMHVYAYPTAAAWQEGIGTTGGASGSTGYPWGPVSIGDAVYLYRTRRQPLHPARGHCPDYRRLP